MKIKSIPALVKAVGTEDDLSLGQFTAYASVFGNVDSYGDVVQKGAFADTLSEWTDSGAPIPVYWAHQMGTDPLLNLGHVLSAEEDEKGLLVTAQLDIEHNEKAAYTYQLLKGRRVQQMSFAYDVLDADERDGGGLDLKALKLHEVSVVPLGANQETEILDVKHFISQRQWDEIAAKAGRVLSAKSQTTLQSALDAMSAASKAIAELLDNAQPADDQEKASGTGPAKDEERGSAKSEEPSQNPTVDAWTAQLEFLKLERK